MAINRRPIGTVNGTYFTQADLDGEHVLYLHHESKGLELRAEQARSTGRTRGAFASQAARHERQAELARHNHARYISRVGKWGYVSAPGNAPFEDWFDENLEKE